MSQDEDHADKPYEASRKKLEDARKRGEIARSQDLLSLASLAAFLVALTALFSQVMWPLTLSMQGYLATESQRTASHLFEGHLERAMSWAMVFLSILFLVPFLAVLGLLVATRQIVFAGEKVHPKLNRVSLVANFRKKFGVSGLVEFLKSFLKVAVLSVMLWLWIRDTGSRFDQTVLLGASPALAHVYDTVLRWLGQILGAYLFFAAVDVLWQRHEHARKNRMSHKEMRDEHKNEEGDEHIRQQRRARAEEIATNRMLLDVPKAAVVIVNPSHYAVALRWDGGRTDVPRCVAKGVDETAQRIREVATRSGVPIYRDPPTARQLFAAVKIGSLIGQDHYKAVAAAIAYARRMQGLSAS